MEDSSSKLIRGCGIGCAVVFGIVIFVLIFGYYKVRDKIEEFKEFEELTVAIETKFGKVEDYVPPIDNEFAKERLERFISVRKELLPEIAKIETELKNFERDIKDSSESFWDKVDLISSGLGILPGMLNYFKLRNDILIKYEMSLGEYYYHYILCYYSLLQKSPGDGPNFNISNNASVTISEREESAADSSVYEERVVNLSKLSNKYFRQFYSNLLSNDNYMIDDNISVMIKEELNKLSASKLRIPWQDGLPGFYNILLEPRKALLDSLYNPVVNPVEMNKIEN